MGGEALPRLLAQIEQRESEMTGLARTLFAGWLERVVGLERPATPASRRQLAH
jgi:hypothetical protein